MPSDEEDALASCCESFIYFCVCLTFWAYLFTRSQKVNNWIREPTCRRIQKCESLAAQMFLILLSRWFPFTLVLLGFPLFIVALPKMFQAERTRLVPGTLH